MSTNTDPADGHLDELALDALRAGEGAPEILAHAESCPHCRAALAGLALLEARLNEAQPGVPEVPREIEVRIFQGYRQSLGKPPQSPFPTAIRRWFLPAAGLAVAGIAALALRVVPPDANKVASQRPVRVVSAPIPAPAGGPEDLQPAAAVDIVDAFRLARALRDGQRVAAGWDADGDGTISRADVQSVARRAVAL